MTKNLATRVFLIVALLVVNAAFGQDQRPHVQELVGEGCIVAIQKWTRHSVNPSAGGIGTYIENWIIRVDRWPDAASRKETFILVEYSLHERGLSDAEVNSKKLRFTLRERREDEHTNCLGDVFERGKRPYKTRPARLSNYERTNPGRSEVIPPLESLPCLIADRPPVVIQ